METQGKRQWVGGKLSKTQDVLQERNALSGTKNSSGSKTEIPVLNFWVNFFMPGPRAELWWRERKPQLCLGEPFLPHALFLEASLASVVPQG